MAILSNIEILSTQEEARWKEGTCKKRLNFQTLSCSTKNLFEIFKIIFLKFEGGKKTKEAEENSDDSGPEDEEEKSTKRKKKEKVTAFRYLNLNLFQTGAPKKAQSAYMFFTAKRRFILR